MTDHGEPARAGTYGVAPSGFRLPDATRLGPVRLQVADLARSLRYYEETLGFRLTSRDGTTARLSPHGDDRVLVELHERTGARPASRRARLGLYHFAILLPDRAALGRFVEHLATSGTRAGSADHLVSEALYLTDPDGLGIEVYADRPRAEWRRSGQELLMGTEPLDIGSVVASARGEPWSGMPAGTTIGHVHLHVGDLEKGAAYFAGALGFDRTVWSYPGALFLAAGGYHHHLGTNTWAGPQASAPGPDDARLLEWTIEVPDERAIDALERSLRGAGYPAERTPDGALVTRDPWGTGIRVAPPG